jgi:hypothetical protein
MGSYNEFLTGRGKNRAEALRAAWDEYVEENGTRCSLRPPIKGRLLRTVPPVKPMAKVERGIEYRWSAEDPTAPKSEWLEEWEFEVWVHS